MTFISGRLAHLGLGKEAVRGTAVAASVWIPRTALDFQDHDKKVENKSSLGVIDSDVDLKLIERWSEGKITGNVRDSSFGYFLMAAFGATSTDATHSGETTVYDHTFARANNNQHQTLTLIYKDANQVAQHANGALKSLEIDLVTNEYLKFVADFMALLGATTTATPTYTTENEFLPKHATIKLAATVAGLSGAAAVKVKQMKITIEKNLEAYMALGSLDPVDFLNKDFMVKGDMTLIWDSLTYHDYVFNETAMAMLLDVKNTDVTIGTAANPELQITFEPMKFDTWARKNTNDAVIEQTVAFQGLFSLADSKTLSAVLTNTTSSY